MEKENNIQVKKSKFTKNVLMILFSNVLSVLSGILIGFVIPKILGVEDYGYYKTFTLYSSYIGLFHFGFIDGIYLIYAGKNFEDFDKAKFRTFTKFLLCMQLIVTSIITLIAMICIKSSLGIILLFVAMNVFSTNITTYFEFISQITMRFKMVSIRGIIKSILMILSISILFLLYKYNGANLSYYIYSSIVILINYMLMFWYIFTYRNIVFGKSYSIKSEKNEIIKIFKVGIVLLISNLVGQFIFIIDQQFVNVYFSNEVYSSYAFAYSMINLITVATNAVSVVLYPTLKQFDEAKVKENYMMINCILLIFVSCCFSCYFILVPFVNKFLLEYVSSLETFRIILPGLIFSAGIQVIKYNCYKKFDMIKQYLIISSIVLGLAIISDFIVYYIFKTTNAISFVSIIILFLWYLIIEIYFVKKYKCPFLKNLVFTIYTVLIFYFTSFYFNSLMGLFLYITLICIGIILIYNKSLKSILSFIKKRNNN